MTTLTEHQEGAVKTAVARLKGVNVPEPLTYLGGFAGTGKSTILPFILEALGYPPEQVTFVAPTGKAAKVMRSKLKAQGYPNSNASTIHSAIYRAKPAPIATLEGDVASHEEALAKLREDIMLDHHLDTVDDARAGAVIEKLNLLKHPEVEKQIKLIQRLKNELEAAYREDKISFQLNPDAPIQFSQLIVVDEASMVGKNMAADLMQFGVPVLAMGDPGQLPPVEDEPGLTAGIPDYFLREIHRQAADNPIIRLSVLARDGKDLPKGDYGNGVVVMDRNQYDYRGTFEDRPQFIVGMNKTRWKITQTLRADFGFTSDPRHRVGPKATEPVVVKKNTREHPNLVNGTECIALSDLDLKDGEAISRFSFEDDEGVRYADKAVFQGKFEEHYSRKAGEYSAPQRTAYRALKNSIVMDWSYVITAHTAQGSQWDDVVVIDESSVFRDDCDKWLYTAVTRAAKKLAVLR